MCFFILRPNRLLIDWQGCSLQLLQFIINYGQLAQILKQQVIYRPSAAINSMLRQRQFYLTRVLRKIL